MRILNSNLFKNIAFELVSEATENAYVVGDILDFHDSTGTEFNVPLYIIEGLHSGHCLNTFFEEANLPKLDLSPYYKVMKMAMQGVALQQSEVVEFLALVSNLWDWQDKLHNVLASLDIVPHYTLIGYVMGLTNGDESNGTVVTSESFSSLICAFFDGGIDIDTFFRECNNLKNK